ncbi:hypothetical protein NST02_23570 [Robertmurraya sp. FSL W8-0741]|uniref:hypothetical protein n=1 Tax=Robertmurraya sp. FSL W8-0741 TaxID=2954629 RepID=UPI0030F70D5B
MSVATISPIKMALKALQKLGNKKIYVHFYQDHELVLVAGDYIENIEIETKNEENTLLIHLRSLSFFFSDKENIIELELADRNISIISKDNEGDWYLILY